MDEAVLYLAATFTQNNPTTNKVVAIATALQTFKDKLVANGVSEDLAMQSMQQAFGATSMMNMLQNDNRRGFERLARHYVNRPSGISVT